MSNMVLRDASASKKKKDRLDLSQVITSLFGNKTVCQVSREDGGEGRRWIFHHLTSMFYAKHNPPSFKGVSNAPKELGVRPMGIHYCIILAELTNTVNSTKTSNIETAVLPFQTPQHLWAPKKIKILQEVTKQKCICLKKQRWNQKCDL